MSHSPIDKWSKDMNRKFSDEEIKIIYSHMKKCSKVLSIREMQIKTTLRYHFTPKILKGKVTNVGENVEKLGHIHCWWSCELIQPFQRTIWNYAQKVIKLPAIDPLLSLFPKMTREKGKEPIYSKIFVAGLFVVAKNWVL